MAGQRPQPAGAQETRDAEVDGMKLVDRVKAILLTPRTEWPVIEQERTTMTDLFIGYVAILAAIPEVAHLIGQSFIGEARAPIVSGLLRAVIAYVASIAMVYVIAGVINLLVPRFGGEKSFSNALKLSVHSHTPLWLAGVFLLIPGLNFLLILGVYGVYLLWVGLPMLMRVPNDRAFPYAVFVTACALIPAVVLAIV
jgi:Yip1 domain